VTRFRAAHLPVTPQMLQPASLSFSKLSSLKVIHIIYYIIYSVQGASNTDGISQATSAIGRWYIENGMLKNVFKSDVITFNGKKSFDLPHSITIADTNLTRSKSLTALGVTFDRSLKCYSFVSKTVSACNFHLCALYHLWSTLGPKLCATVARAVALSKLDYCNSILCEASAVNIDKLQGRRFKINLHGSLLDLRAAFKPRWQSIIYCSVC